MASTRTLEKIIFADSFSLPSGDGFTPQSLAFKNKNERIVFCSGSTPNNVVKANASSYTKLGKKISSGHVNGATYCKKNGYFYTTAYASGSNMNKIKVWDSNFKSKFTLTLTSSATGIAYDPITTQFYISSGSKIYIYPYEAFQTGGKVTVSPKSINKSFMNDTRAGQDIGGYNGVVMVCRSFDGIASQRAFIDCYNAGTGKYIKSYYSDDSELESVAVDGSGYMHIIYATKRKIVRTSNKFQLKGSAATITGYTAGSTAAISTTAANGGQIVVDKAMEFLGEGPSRFAKYMGFSKGNAWCSEFVWCIIDMCGYSDLMNNGKKWYAAGDLEKWLFKHSEIIYHHTGTGTPANAQAGDIVIFSWTHWKIGHVGFIRKSGTAKRIYTVEGNYGNKVRTSDRGIGDVYGIYRPPYSSMSGSITSNLVLQVSPEKLYSSANFTYLEEEEEDTETLKLAINKMIANAGYSGTLPSDTPANIEILKSSSIDNTKRASTRVKQTGEGSRLPQKLNHVEAPFVELELGGFAFGTYRNGSYPNYIQNLNVIKTNGSMNEYTITLIHQIQFGDNPNFIDELLSANGYNKIKIKYGDAESGLIFTDINALLISVSSRFDFTNCNITYTLKATSSAVSQIATKNTYSSVTDKPSNVIRDLLYNKDSSLLKMFPGMRNKQLVEKKNLIPNNDVSVAIDTVIDVNALSYLKYLVSLMTSTTADTTLQQSTYYLTIEDDTKNEFGGAYFKITEIPISVNVEAVNNALLYEVDINYPEPNLVYDFSINSDYAWAMSYDVANEITDYNYEIDSDGDIKTYSSNANLLTKNQIASTTKLQQNWWTQMTEFPVSASLRVKGLTSSMLLLSYIKINCYYYGSKRTTSGLYIVTGQTDSLSSAGYSTMLSLLRVGAADEMLSVDGRVVT